MLDRREIDLTAGGILMTNSRKPYVDFCIPMAELQGKKAVVGQLFFFSIDETFLAQT